MREAGRGHITRRGVWLMPMGVSADRFSPALRTPAARGSLLRRTDANEDSVLLVYSGRLAPEKNLPLLFDTFEQLQRASRQDYRLVIAGDGILRKSLEAQCRKRFPGGSVNFLGRLDPAELAVTLACCDAFVHPNPAEPFGIAPLEAMAAGLPLVACNSGGVLSYANSTNAWLSDPSPVAMAGAVDSVFEDEAVRQQKTGTARAMAESLDWDKVAVRFRGLYERFVAGMPPQPDFESTAGNWLGMEASAMQQHGRPSGSGLY